MDDKGNIKLESILDVQRSRCYTLCKVNFPLREEPFTYGEGEE